MVRGPAELPSPDSAVDSHTSLFFPVYTFGMPEGYMAACDYDVCFYDCD